MAVRYPTDVLVGIVRTHAEDNYEMGGWDILVECWSDEEIREAIGRASTEAGAIKKVADQLGVVDSYRADIMATAF